jgi:hypothetical protein
VVEDAFVAEVEGAAHQAPRGRGVVDSDVGDAGRLAPTDRDHAVAAVDEAREFVGVHLDTEQNHAVGEQQAVLLVEELAAAVDDRGAREEQQVAAELLCTGLDAREQRRVEIEAAGRERRLVGEHAEDSVVGSRQATGRGVGHVLRLLDHPQDACPGLLGDADSLFGAPVQNERDGGLAHAGEFGDLLLGDSAIDGS